MFGIFLGLVSLFFLVKVLRGHGPAHTRRGWGWRGGYGGGERWFLRRLFEKLETTPEQEREIRAALDEVFSETRTMKGEWRRTRDDLADALGAEEFDAERLTGAFARQDSVLDDIRRVWVGAAARVHAVLEPEQRERLVRFLRRGGHGGGGGGPYRASV